MKKTINYFFTGCIAAAMLAVASCDDEKSLPKIDGYNNSNEVAKDNLVAHWTFDNTNEERLSNAEPTATFGTVGFTSDGQIKQALSLDQGVLVYDPIASINTANALNNFTVSMWVNVSGNKFATPSGFTSFFGLIPTGATDIWGDLVLAAETGWHLPSSDTLVLKGLLNTHPVGGGNNLQDNIAVNSANGGDDFLGANEWSHFVIKWDAAAGKFYIFANGEDVGGYTQRGDPGVVGPLIMSVPVKPVFGSLASNDIGFAGAPDQQTWNPYATALIDDVRIYNTLLDQAEITALYNLGVAGR